MPHAHRQAKKELDTLGAEDVLKVLATDKDRSSTGRAGPRRTQINLIRQETTTDEDGREVYVDYLARLG